jgi:putative DNA primase/helicase
MSLQDRLDELGIDDPYTEWSKPQALTEKIAAQDYPLDALPDNLRAAVEEVLGFTKAPVVLAASSALASLSLATQAHVDIKRADKLTGPTGLFLLSIADSGERKSTCDGFFSKPIQVYEQEQAELAKPLLKDHAAAVLAWNAEREGVLSAIKDASKKGKPVAELRDNLTQIEHDRPVPPRIAKLIRGDETPENLAYVLAKEWPSGGVISSEAGVVLGAHGMGKDSIMRNLALLNILWDGGELSVGRRSTESFIVRGARLTVALQVQEATLRSFFDRSGGLARGTGFFARFLVAWPESTQGYRPFTDPPDSWPKLAAFHRRITEILNTSVSFDEGGALNPAMMAFTPEAKTAWVAFHDVLERELRSGGELYDVRDVASKTADNAARLAALFHVFEHGFETAVDSDSFENASRIAAWHLHEARRFFGELALPVELANAVRLDNWLLDICQRQHKHSVPRRELQRLGPVRDKEPLKNALKELEDLGRVRVIQEGRRIDIKINPQLLDGAAR